MRCWSFVCGFGAADDLLVLTWQGVRPRKAYEEPVLEPGDDATGACPVFEAVRHQLPKHEPLQGVFGCCSVVWLFVCPVGWWVGLPR